MHRFINRWIDRQIDIENGAQRSIKSNVGETGPMQDALQIVLSTYIYIYIYMIPSFMKPTTIRPTHGQCFPFLLATALSKSKLVTIVSRHGVQNFGSGYRRPTRTFWMLWLRRGGTLYDSFRWTYPFYRVPYKNDFVPFVGSISIYIIARLSRQHIDCIYIYVVRLERISISIYART
jgi:hypothetical protein